jgi:hypothetical protein
MSVNSSDLIIRSTFEAAFADLRANSWLLIDVFNSLVLINDPLTSTDYGQKEVQRAMNWFLSTDIPVYMQYRIDNVTFPSITIIDMGASEMVGQRTALADDGHTETWSPENVVSTPQYVVPPFAVSNYDSTSGLITMPSSVNTSQVVPGQFLVSVASGKSYVIDKIAGTNQFYIEPNVTDNITTCYVLPLTPNWNLQREQTFFKQNYAIMVAAISDPVYCTWLTQIVTYVLGRYKEAYLEARGYEVSSFDVGPLTIDQAFNNEQVYYKQISLTGECEMGWAKYVAPQFQGYNTGIVIANAPASPPDVLPVILNEGIQMEGDLPPGAINTSAVLGNLDTPIGNDMVPILGEE